MPAPSAITSTPSSKPDKSEAVRSRLPSGLQRSGSTLDAAIQPATDASLYLRRNSYDGSSIPDRRGGLASPETDNATEITNGDAKTESRQPLPHGQPPGLLRRVTTTSAHRKPTPSHHSMFHDEHNSILGGTKEFFKHRLRSRTNSSSLHSADAADDDATAKEHLSDMHGSDVNGVQKRPRRRSDAEVKSRNAELPPPPPPAIPDQFQQRYPAAVGPRGAEKYIKSSVAKKDNIKADSLQLLHPPRTSIGDGQSEWVAISPPPSSSSTHERDTKTPLSNPLSQRQRRSHDETIRLSTDRGEYRDYRSKHREVVGPADSTIRLTKDQMDLIRLRPLNGDSKSSETRPRSRHNTNESSSPSPPPQSSRKIPSSIGRSSIERLDSPRPDGSIASPLLPKLPPPPSASLSPLSPKRHVRSDSKQALPDSDSIDHHIRRLRSDKKSRRSSFMSTISQMLGRKE
ncbi:hypothetical protein GGH98_002101 [Coemansia sp. RSA 454]|nr:hypothetical protein GGH98_002101 [Coemansia sp. RSA 454]